MRCAGAIQEHQQRNELGIFYPVGCLPAPLPEMETETLHSVWVSASFHNYMQTPWIMVCREAQPTRSLCISVYPCRKVQYLLSSFRCCFDSERSLLQARTRDAAHQTSDRFSSAAMAMVVRCASGASPHSTALEQQLHCAERRCDRSPVRCVQSHHGCAAVMHPFHLHQFRHSSWNHHHVPMSLQRVMKRFLADLKQLACHSGCSQGSTYARLITAVLIFSWQTVMQRKYGLVLSECSALE